MIEMKKGTILDRGVYAQQEVTMLFTDDKRKANIVGVDFGDQTVKVRFKCPKSDTSPFIDTIPKSRSNSLIVTLDFAPGYKAIIIDTNFDGDWFLLEMIVPAQLVIETTTDQPDVEHTSELSQTQQHSDKSYAPFLDNAPIHFLSSHSDTSFLEKVFPNNKIFLIKHPFLNSDWSEQAVYIFCKDVIDTAVSAEFLIMNGDYFLVSTILKQRLTAGKYTGFVSFEKVNSPSVDKDVSGAITYTNQLIPKGVRWIPPTSNNHDSWKRIFEIFLQVKKAGFFPGLFITKKGWEVWVYPDKHKQLVPGTNICPPTYFMEASSAEAVMEMLFSHLKNMGHIYGSYIRR